MSSDSVLYDNYTVSLIVATHGYRGGTRYKPRGIILPPEGAKRTRAVKLTPEVISCTAVCLGAMG